MEGSGHSPRPRCSKLLGGNARFTCSQKYPKILWECLGHCSELLQIKWDLRIECGSASEIDQTSYKPEMVLKWLVGILIHECKSAILLDISTSSILFIFIPCHTFVALALTSLHWSKWSPTEACHAPGSEVSGSSLPLPPAGTSLYQI